MSVGNDAKKPMPRFVDVNDLERYAVVLDNGHKYVPWMSITEVQTADIAEIFAVIAGGCDAASWKLPDLETIRFLLQREGRGIKT